MFGGGNSPNICDFISGAGALQQLIRKQFQHIAVYCPLRMLTMEEYG